MQDYHAIFSAESKPYQKWQSILLAHTHQQVRQPGSLICLLSGQDDPEFMEGYSGGRIFNSRLATHHSINRDNFPGYNKNSSFCDYLTKTPVGDRVYLLLDPDMVFTRSWVPVMEPGEEIGEHVWYMDPTQESGKTVIKRYARRHADRVQAVGFPLVMRESALREIIDRWHLLTETLRGDLWVRDKLNWVTDMWSFTIACAESEVRFREERNCSFTGDQEIDRPLVHYTYGTHTPLGYHWDKRNYTAWNSLPPLRPDVPPAQRQFHEIFNSFLKEHKLEPVCVKDFHVLDFITLERVRGLVDFLPDGLTCHEVCEVVLKNLDFDHDFTHVKGKFQGCDHSWLASKTRPVILDPYPWACASGPLLLTLEGYLNPWRRVYDPLPVCLIRENNPV